MNTQQFVEILNKLPQEFIEAINTSKRTNKIIDAINESKNNLINAQLIFNNPELYLKKVQNQLNLILPKTLIDSKEPYIINIRNDINFYRKLYEKEINQVNKIIINTIESLNQIYPTTKNLQENLKNYTEKYAVFIQQIQIPLLIKKIEFTQINFENFSNEKKNSFINDRNEISKKIDKLFLEVDIFFIKFSEISVFNSNKIEKTIKDFLVLPKSVKELSDLMIKAKRTFERSCRIFSDFSNKETIDREFANIQNNLNELNEMKKKIQDIKINQMKEDINDEKNNIEKIKKEFEEFEIKLKKQSDLIWEEINKLRKKYGEKEEELEEFTPLGLTDIETENFYNKIFEKSYKINEQISIINESLNAYMNEVKDKYRADLLFIISLSNSMDFYLEQIKRSILNLIKEIKRECNAISIFIGFIGYKDFNDLDSGESYINLELTDNYQFIIQNLEYIK